MTSFATVAAADCEQVLIVRDRAAGAVAVVAVHDTTLGPAHGGIRRHRYPDLGAAVGDALLLAQAMTWKCALADVPAGGGKAVLLDADGLDRAAGYRLVGRTVERLGGVFLTGPDVGTTAADLAEVAGTTRHVATGDGAGDLAGATAAGVFAAMEALATRLGRGLPGLHVVVQGLGAVGLPLCERLHAAGARVTAADPDPVRAARAADRCGARIVPPEQVLAVPCDVFAPCALGGVLTTAVAAALPARGVCGAANNVFAEPAAAVRLHARGVLAVPDFVANAGALIQGALWHLRGERVGPERLARIGVTAGELLDRAAREDVPPSELALRLARARVARAPAVP